jgi:spermidine/putrescine transport system permease protein
MAFTMSLDDFIITHFTKGAGINTLSTLIYSEVRRGIQPSMYALSTLIFATVLLLLLITNFSPDEVDRRDKMQLPPDEKLERADYGVINSGSFEELISQLSAVADKLEKYD